MLLAQTMAHLHCVDDDEVRFYKNCYCDPSRRLITGIDGWTLQCGKCDVCGRLGHTRHFPGPIPHTGGWCNYHWDKLCEISVKKMMCALSRTHCDPSRVSMLLLGGDMGADKHMKKARGDFIHADWRSWDFEKALTDYLEAWRVSNAVGPKMDGQAEDELSTQAKMRIALLREIPWTFDVEQKRKIIEELMSMCTET